MFVFEKENKICLVHIYKARKINITLKLKKLSFEYHHPKMFSGCSVYYCFAYLISFQRHLHGGWLPTTVKTGFDWFLANCAFLVAS